MRIWQKWENKYSNNNRQSLKTKLAKNKWRRIEFHINIKNIEKKIQIKMHSKQQTKQEHIQNSKEDRTSKEEKIKKYLFLWW